MSEDSLRLFIAPQFNNADQGDGGVRRVVEAQLRYLPALGFEIVADPRDAQIIACHSGEWVPRGVNPAAVRVVHCHGLYWDDPQYQWWAWTRSRNEKIISTFRMADAVVSPAEWVAAILRRDFWLDTQVLYNGIELPAQVKRGRGRPKAITVDQQPSQPVGSNHGRYVLWNKARVDPICEVDSLGALIERMPDVDFCATFAPKAWMDRAAAVGGSGPWQLDNLLLTGKLPHAAAMDYVRRAGVYLCTTREVFSVGLLEAMAAGVPCVGYGWGGQREVIRHKIDGWLAAPGDINGLAAGVEYVLAHWDEMSRAAAARARDFTWRDQMARCADIYRDAFARFGNGVDRPKVSVVIPCHNLEKYVGAAIGSALSQRIAGGHEIIVVDDASTDGSAGEINAALVKELALPTRIHRTKVVSLAENRYLAGALNAGIAEARGKYVLALDADNMLPDGALANLASALDDREDLDVVYGAVQLMDEAGAEGGGAQMWGAPWPPEVFSYDALLSHKPQVQSSAMFRRKVWSRVGGYRQHELPRVSRGRVIPLSEGGGLVRLNSDADFWCRAATLGFKFANVSPTKPTLRYRIRVDSMSRTVQDYDWTAWCPRGEAIGGGARVPAGVSGRIFTLEPVVVSVIVAGLDDPVRAKETWRSVESLWPQTFDNWEVLVVDPWGDSLAPQFAPYARRVGSLGDAVAQARGSYLLMLEAGQYLHPEAISRLVGGVQWSLQNHREDMRSRFAYSDWICLERGSVETASDSRVGAILLPKSFVSASIGVAAATSPNEGWGNWRERASAAGLCGQYVGEPLMMAPHRLASLLQGTSGGAGGEDRELAGCGCGGGARRSTPAGIKGGPAGCSGPGCGSGAVVSYGAKRGREAASDAQALGGGGADETMVLLEYVGGAGSRTFASPTGRKGASGELIRYRFGTDSGHSSKYVYESDVEALLRLNVLRRAVIGSVVTPVSDAMAKEVVGAR